MIFSGEGIGGSQAISSSAWSGERRAASSASFNSAPPAIASRSVGYSFPKRAERSTTPPSTTAPYLVEPPREKVAMRCVAMRGPITGGGEVHPGPAGAKAASAGVHALGHDDASGGGRRQEADECFGGISFLTVCGHGRRENQILLQFTGE